MRRLLVLTERPATGRPLVDVVAETVEGGARWVLLRGKDLPHARRAALAARLRSLLAPVDGRLSVAGPDPLGGDAVHLAAADPPPHPAPGLVGRSCHDAAELARLGAEDYVTLSPVFATASKPGYGPPLRPDGLRPLIASAGRPVLALGGVRTPEQIRACLDAGAHGVAVMGAVMHAGDPAAVTADLVAALPGEAP